MGSNRSRRVASELSQDFPRKRNTTVFGQRYIEISFYSARSWTSLGTIFFDEHVNFDANAVFPTDVEDLPTEAI